MKHISPTFMYNHTDVFEVDHIYKNPPPNVISPIVLAIFISLWGFTHDSAETAGALTDPQLPAPASNVCTTDAWLGGVARVAPPNKNPGYAGGDYEAIQVLCNAIGVGGIRMNTDENYVCALVQRF